MKKITALYCLKIFGIACTVSSLYLFQVTAESTTSSTKLSENKNVDTFISFGAWVSQLFSKEQYISDTHLTIENISTMPTKNEVLITWIANDLAVGRVYYDIASPVRIASGTPSVTASKYANYANSKANIRNLSASTTYYYKVLLEESSGGKTFSEELSFRTRE